MSSNSLMVVAEQPKSELAVLASQASKYGISVVNNSPQMLSMDAYAGQLLGIEVTPRVVDARTGTGYPVIRSIPTLGRELQECDGIQRAIFRVSGSAFNPAYLVPDATDQIMLLSRALPLNIGGFSSNINTMNERHADRSRMLALLGSFDHWVKMQGSRLMARESLVWGAEENLVAQTHPYVEAELLSNIVTFKRFRSGLIPLIYSVLHGLPWNDEDTLFGFNLSSVLANPTIPFTERAESSTVKYFHNRAHYNGMTAVYWRGTPKFSRLADLQLLPVDLLWQIIRFGDKALAADNQLLWGTLTVRVLIPNEDPDLSPDVKVISSLLRKYGNFSRVTGEEAVRRSFLDFIPGSQPPTSWAAPFHYPEPEVTLASLGNMNLPVSGSDVVYVGRQGRAPVLDHLQLRPNALLTGTSGVGKTTNLLLMALQSVGANLFFVSPTLKLQDNQKSTENNPYLPPPGFFTKLCSGSVFTISEYPDATDLDLELRKERQRAINALAFADGRLFGQLLVEQLARGVNPFPILLRPGIAQRAFTNFWIGSSQQLLDMSDRWWPVLNSRILWFLDDGGSVPKMDKLSPVSNAMSGDDLGTFARFFVQYLWNNGRKNGLITTLADHSIAQAEAEWPDGMVDEASVIFQFDEEEHGDVTKVHRRMNKVRGKKNEQTGNRTILASGIDTRLPSNVTTSFWEPDVSYVEVPWRVALA